jgi:hypothetical protein
MARRTSEPTVALRERDRNAAQLREDGWHWAAIAEHLGYASPGAAHTAVKRMLDRIPVEAVAELRATENQRLAAARKAALDILRRRHIAVSQGRLVYETVDGVEKPVEDDAPALKALEVLVKIDEAVRKLNGLDSPQQIELSGAVNWTLVGVDPDALT